MEKIQQEIETFIRENFLLGMSNRRLNPEDSFMGQGIVDSTGILELVSFIEKTYGFKVRDEEMMPENLDSVHNVVAFINSKHGAPAEE